MKIFKKTITFILLLSLSLALAGTEQASIKQESDEFLRAKLAYKNKDYSNANLLFNIVLDRHGASTSSLLYLAKIHLRTQQLDEAEAYIHRTLKHAKNSDQQTLAEVQFWVGQIMEKQAEASSIFSVLSYADSAHNAYLESIKLAVNNAKYRSALIEFYLDAPAIAGGDFSKAIEHSYILFKIDQKAGYLSLIACFDRNDNAQQAENLFQQALKRFPLAPELYQKRAFLYLKQKKYELALADFKSSVRISVKTDKERVVQLFSHYQLALLTLKTKKSLSDGMQALKFYIDNYISVEELYTPPIVWAKFRLANIYELDGDKQQALSLYKEIKQTTDDKELLKLIKSHMRHL
jgi:tetratricopeptide (TPR) repeat protein